MDTCCKKIGKDWNTSNHIHWEEEVDTERQMNRAWERMKNFDSLEGNMLLKILDEMGNTLMEEIILLKHLLE